MQPLADVGKLISKESFRPKTRSLPCAYWGRCWRSSPASPASDHPFGDIKDGVGFYGIDVPIGVLYFFAFGSFSFYGLLLGGWSSGSKYSFLGAMRSAAQLISYEVSMGLALLGAIMMSGSLSLTEVVHAQDESGSSSPRSSAS